MLVREQAQFQDLEHALIESQRRLMDKDEEVQMAVRNLQKKMLGSQDEHKATEELMDYIQTTNETLTTEIVTLRVQLAQEREQTDALQA